MDIPADPFIRWGAAHFGALAVILLAAVGIIISGRRCSEEGRRLLCRGLALVILLEFIVEHIVRQCMDSYGPWQENLPLHFCSVMMLIAFVALWRRQRWASAFVYFGVLAASIQALITTDLEKSFPSIQYFFFFLSHGLLFIAALVVPLVQRWRARRVDIVRCVLLGDVYLLSVIPLNLMLGTNYGFTQHGPADGSILDYLGPGPWYYLWLQVPALLLFALMYLPVRERKAKMA